MDTTRTSLCEQDDAFLDITLPEGTVICSQSTHFRINIMDVTWDFCYNKRKKEFDSMRIDKLEPYERAQYEDKCSICGA